MQDKTMIGVIRSQALGFNLIPCRSRAGASPAEIIIAQMVRHMMAFAPSHLAMKYAALTKGSTEHFMNKLSDLAWQLLCA